MMLAIQYTAFGVQLIALIVFYFLLKPIISGAVYFPTKQKNLEIIKNLSSLKPGQKAADLGSGDGRILLALAETDAKVVGYEINPLLVLKSRHNIKSKGLEKKVRVFWRSFWKADLSGYEVIIVYGLPHMMERLKRKLERELKPGSKIISNVYQFPGWKPTERESGVYLYVKE